ncbi:MAG: ABC transporter ATP-binding protein [Pseudomonadota bacterium]|nr:ABC transporter ATP-binding protein [Pseudomonadota bacterium]
MNKTRLQQTGHQQAGIPPRDGYDWHYLARIALEHRRDLVMANVIAVIAVLAATPIPLLMPLMVDEVLLGKPGVLVGWMNSLFPEAWHGPVLYITVILGVTVMLRLVSLVFNVMQTRRFTRISKDVTYRLRQELLLRLRRVAMSEYESLGGGTVASHLVTDLETVDQFVGSTIARFLVAILTILGTAVVLLLMHWQLALFILLMNPVVVYFTMILGKHVKTLKKRENAAFEVFQQVLTETLDGIHQIRAANREEHYLSRVVRNARQVKEYGTAFAWRSDAANRASFLVFLVGFDVFRAVSMLMVVFSSLTVGEMMAVFGYLWFMMAPVQEVLNIQYSYFGAQGALDRINRLLRLDEEPQYPHLVNPFEGKATVGVRLEGIEFSYGEDKVLSGVSVEIAPGEKVALVGASGGGKSTLVQVILGLYPPDSGMLYFDGVPVTDIGMDVVRENVSTVLQHPAMFNDTVRENLTMGRDLEDVALWRALEVAQLRDTVDAMPRGLDSVVGRSGVRLSGGQRQRLAIARMVLGDPKVVILDEATSALDTDTEARLHYELRRFLRGRTTIIIAHRLSAVKQADQVYVFEDGRIVESGGHDTLIAARGLYAKLYGKSQH